MSALDTMKATLHCAKTEAATLRIRVRQLDEKLVDAAAVSEREADALRQGADVLVTENARLVGENTRQAEEIAVRRRDTERLSLAHQKVCGERDEALRLNTPLKEALRAADDALLGLAGEVGWLAGSASAGACIECGSLPWIGTACRLCKAMNVALKALRPNPAVTGTTSDNTSIRKPEPSIASLLGRGETTNPREGEPGDAETYSADSTPPVRQLAPDECPACHVLGLSMERLGGACHALECPDPTAWLRARGPLGVCRDYRDHVHAHLKRETCVGWTPLPEGGPEQNRACQEPCDVCDGEPGAEERDRG